MKIHVAWLSMMLVAGLATLGLILGGTVRTIVMCNVVGGVETELTASPISSAIVIPIALHIISMENGTGELSDEEIEEQIDALNDGFANTNYQFSARLGLRSALIRVASVHML